MINLTECDKKFFVPLPEERRLCCYQWGDDQAKPVLFIPGAGMSGCLGLDPTPFRERNLKLIGIDRPGLGESTIDKEKSLLTWIDDVACLIHGNLGFKGINSAHAIAFSQGAPFGLALASRGLLKSLALVAPQDEFQHHMLREAIKDDNFRHFVEKIAMKQAPLELKHITHEKLKETILESCSEQDRKFYSSQDFQDKLADALKAGFSNGNFGYVQDVEIALSEWSFDLGKISTPVQIWFGKKDFSPMHCMDEGKFLESRIKNCSRHVLEDEGSSILWTKTEDIVKNLIEV